jgi:hypothetical protein
MRRILVPVALALAATPAVAQNKSLVFTGRFPFVSFDTVNERTGGSITQLSEFALTYVTPGAGAFARTWLPATALECYIGDPLATRNYTFFKGFKTYFQRMNVAAPFIKFADRSKNDPRLFYWTVRDQDATLDITVFQQNGTGTAKIQGGDFVRLTENGNLEYFITQAQIMTAAGTQPGSFIPGASAICQDSQGNLYYSPAEGFNSSGTAGNGHYVSGNMLVSGPKFCFDGSIIKIPASAITYDARGNVQSIAADSSYVIFHETEAGPNGGPSTRQMVGNAGTVDRDGILTPNPAVIANLVGLALDPNNSQPLTAAWPQGVGQTFDTVPHFLFCADDGKWAGTIWSTNQNSVGLTGSLAVVNGVKCGSDTPGLPADGSWLGVNFDYANFQPTLMGLAVVDAPPFVPHVADVPDFGALSPTATNLEMDFNVGGTAAAGAGVFLVLTFGPIGPNAAGKFIPAFNFGTQFGASSFNSLFTLPNPVLASPISVFLGTANANGYLSFIFPNPNTPATTGLVLVAHGVALQGPTAKISNPIVLQYK